MRHSPALAPRPGCPHRRMRRLLTKALPSGLILSDSGFRPWASANFVGARHRFDCLLGAGATAPCRLTLERQLSTMDWPLAGHIVADLAILPVADAPDSIGLRIEILTVED